MGMIAVSHGVQTAWAAAIREGYTIRGAIELGQVYWSESETIGPAFVSSYLLESKVAVVSRVIVGPRFLQNLLECMNDDWAKWPSSEWFSVSHDDLIEISLQTLKDDLKDNLQLVETLRGRASTNAYRYDHLLEVLRADHIRKAERADFERALRKLSPRSR